MLGSMVALEAVDAEASGSNRTLFTVKTAENRTVYYSKNQGRKDTFPSPPPVASALAHCPNKYILNLGIKTKLVTDGAIVTGTYMPGTKTSQIPLHPIHSRHARFLCR